MPCFLKILLASLRTSPSMPGRIWSRNSTHGDLGAEPPPDRAELEADDAATDHDQVPGHLRPVPARRSRIDDPLLVDLDTRQRGHRRAGGDDDILRAHGAVADLDRVGALEARVALQPLDLVLLEQEFDAAGQALHGFLALRRAWCRGRARRRSVLMPHLASVPSCASSNSSEAWSNALDGMQPTLRQVPPSVSRLSAQAVLSRAARRGSRRHSRRGRRRSPERRNRNLSHSIFRRPREGGILSFASRQWTPATRE